MKTEVWEGQVNGTNYRVITKFVAGKTVVVGQTIVSGKWTDALDNDGVLLSVITHLKHRVCLCNSMESMGRSFGE